MQYNLLLKGMIGIPILLMIYKKAAKNAIFNCVAFIIFLFVQCLFWGLSLDTLSWVDGTILLNSRKYFKADIFFSGEINGFVGLNGCDFLGSASRRATILKKHNNYLYFDLGNFSSSNLNISIFLLNNLKYLDISGINLTLNDLKNIGVEHILKEKDNFFSANINNNSIIRFKKLPLELKNGRNENIEKVVFVTGIASKNILYTSLINLYATKKEIINYINDLYSHSINADIKILLFNEQYFLLKEVLKNIKINFDFIVCQASPENNPNNTTKIYGVPVIYPDYFGRSLAKVNIYYYNTKKYFEIEYIRVFRKIPTDSETEEAKNIIKED